MAVNLGQLLERPTVNIALEGNNLAQGIPIAYPAPIIKLRTPAIVQADLAVAGTQAQQKPLLLLTNTQGLGIVPHQAGGQVVAVGTTVTRTLETIVREVGRLAAHSGWSTLFIYPGYQFGAVEALVTNFHLPRSTLFLLVCAFAGRELMHEAYRIAIAERYRFYSYGDAMLIQ